MLAENEEGYRNLVRITSGTSLHGFYRKPRISKKYLAEHASGLVGFSGCLAGELCQELIAGKYDEAKHTASEYQDIFGKGNFFLEVQDHHLPPDAKVSKAMFQLEKDLNIPLVATNDSHYVSSDDSRAHEILLCVQTGGSMNDEKRFKFDTQEFYIKTAAQMAELFPQNPEVLTATMQFAEALQPDAEQGRQPFPGVSAAGGAGR